MGGNTRSTTFDYHLKAWRAWRAR